MSRGFEPASNYRYVANRWRVVPGPGQESVWDYPRPPRIERVEYSLCVEHSGRRIARSSNGWRVLETSHPPVYYLPPASVAAGVARYWDLVAGERVVVRDAGWSYPAPSPVFTVLAEHFAFYAGRLDACYVGTERVTAQAGDFYGGWITSGVVGPFKGAAGTWGW
jgi:uncharacterized protein (DUF427 family)